MAQALVLSGADVALVDMNEEGAKEAATRLLETFKADNPDARTPKITAHACDVADSKSIDACLADILSQHEKVTTLLTSAGFTENFPAEDYPADRFRKLMEVNVDGTYFFATAVAQHIFARSKQTGIVEEGAMIFVGSMSAAIVNVPQPQAPYNASKAAVRQLAASLAVEWAQKGIRVNCISPGYMLTALTEKILEGRPDFKEEWTSRIPMGKMGKPENLMGAVTFLASDASSYITGADLRIDGGYTLI
jgi:D-arabinitol 2-dehydrogenase